MSSLFTPLTVGKMELKNRFVCSATYEAMATENGVVTDHLAKRYDTLAKGDIGLIISGHMYVHPRGKAMTYQTGIYSDEAVPGLKRLTDAVHNNGGKIVFQIAHAGRQAPRKLTGSPPLAPSGKGCDPVSLNRPQMMSNDDIRGAIAAFAKAANRAKAAGADGVQLHAAHGYLINEFLSPFYNDRHDDWGGSDVNRFRFLKELVSSVKDAVDGDLPVLVKLNTRDFTPKEGITPDLAAKYAGWLAELDISGLEVSCGTYYSFHTVRGDIPIDELARGLPFWMRPMAKLKFKKLKRLCSFEESFNLQAARTIKPVLGDIPLILVGGMRRIDQMEAVLNNQDADLISLSRPFVREPLLVKKFKEGKSMEATCISCNKCFAAVYNEFPLKCYKEGLPSGKVAAFFTTQSGEKPHSKTPIRGHL